MSGFQCLITGAGLYVEDSGMFLHGDLFGKREAESTIFVFNGVLSDTGEAAWAHGLLDPQISTRRILIVPRSRDFFERRGVVIVSALNSYLNPHALEYVRRAP